jgi:DNA-binding CsgD family transcriptional regulator
VPRSGILRLSDVRHILTLVGECRELGDDPYRWRTHLLRGLGGLTGAGFGIGAEIGGCRRGPRRDLGTFAWGWENGFDRAGWEQMLGEFEHNPLYNPVMNAYIDRLPHASGECLARADMIPDRDWYPSRYFQTLHRSLRADATLACFQPIPGVPDEFSELYLCRGPGQPDFSARDRAVVRETHAALAGLIGGPLARFADPTPAGLPPRTRQVLRCLLDGDSDKQVAARLGMSGFTVNSHTKLVYRHFGVAGRSELLARWIRRGWRSGT